MSAVILESARTAAGVPVLLVGGVGDFSAAKTFDSGQTFRFLPVGGDPAHVRGRVRTGAGEEREIEIDGTRPGMLTLTGAEEADFTGFWENYLDLSEDYAAGERRILAAISGEEDRLATRLATRRATRRALAEALEIGRGIRILRQDPWETLVTFILSQNNNIPRIRLIVSRLEGAAGRFPEPEDLLSLGTEGLYALGCGFRAKYLVDCAEKFLSGEVDFERVRGAERCEDAAAELSKIRGVGPKVAACALLFGFHRTDAFPVDVWMKKALAGRFPGGFDPAPLGPWAGYAQQCLFYAERYARGRSSERARRTGGKG